MRKTAPKRRLDAYKTPESKSWEIKKKAISVAQATTSSKGNDKSQEGVFKFLNQLLKENDPNQKIGISWLVKKRAFSYVDPSRAFEFCLKCLSSNNHSLFKGILKAVKTQSPMKTDLGFFTSESGETIAHIAAKQDNQKLITSLAEINLEYLRVQDSNGNTAPHIASKFLSQRSIEVMVKKYPGLFWVRNKNGLKPSDYEGGPIIASYLNQDDIKKAWEQDNKTYQLSLSKLNEASEPKKTKDSEIIKSDSKMVEDRYLTK